MSIYHIVADVIACLGKSVTQSIADRVALLTYGVINMSMVSYDHITSFFSESTLNNLIVHITLRKMSLMKTLDLFARERGVVTREQMRNDYCR